MEDTMMMKRAKEKISKFVSFSREYWTPERLSLRLQQLFIIVAHLLLLKWMVYALSESGRLPVVEVMLHFLGMALYGGLLIRGTAYWAKRRYLKESDGHAGHK